MYVCASYMNVGTLRFSRGYQISWLYSFRELWANIQTDIVQGNWTQFLLRITAAFNYWSSLYSLAQRNHWVFVVVVVFIVVVLLFNLDIWKQPFFFPSLSSFVLFLYHSFFWNRISPCSPVLPEPCSVVECAGLKTTEIFVSLSQDS